MFFITNNLKYKYLLKLNQKYSNIQYKLNLFFNNKIDNNLKIAVYSYCIKNGGRARMTTLLINYLNKINFFNIYLFTRKKKVFIQILLILSFYIMNIQILNMLFL